MRRIKKGKNSFFRVKIAILDFSYSHDRLTEFLGLKPSKTIVKGDKSVSGVNAMLNGWFFEPLSTKMDVNARLDLIFKNKKFLQLKQSKFKKCKVVIQCMLDLDGGTQPTINISEKNLELLVRMGASFDLDYYEAAK